MENNYKIYTMENAESGRLIKLYEMTHVAPESFYKNRENELMKDYHNGFLIHMEGIEVDEQRRNSINYENIAKYTELDYQRENAYHDYDYEVHDITWRDMNIADKLRMKFISTVFSLSERVVEKNVEAREIITNNEVSKEPPVIIKKILLPFLIDKRHDIALRYVFATNRNISLVWGRAHTPYFIRELEGQGFIIMKEECPEIELG